jgi:hypothetical protein
MRIGSRFSIGQGASACGLHVGSLASGRWDAPQFLLRNSSTTVCGKTRLRVSFGNMWAWLALPSFSVRRSSTWSCGTTRDSFTGALARCRLSKPKPCTRQFEGHIEGAAGFYHRMIPDTSPDEARQYVQILAAELRATHPEQFAPPPKLRDLNWRKIAAWLLAGLGALGGSWLMMPPTSPAKRLLASAAGFLVGAGIGSWPMLRLQSWPRFLGDVKNENLVFILLVLLTIRLARAWLDPESWYCVGGLFFGVSMMASGFPRKGWSALLKITK